MSFRGSGVPGGQCMVWEFTVKLHQIKATQTSIQHHKIMLKHSIYLNTNKQTNKQTTTTWKWGHDQNWGQKDFEWLYEFYPPKQVFLDFKVPKPMSFRGLRPSDPTHVLGFMTSRSPCSLFKYSGEMEMCPLPTDNILRTPLRPCNISPVYRYSRWGINRKGFNFWLAMSCHGQNVFHLTKYAL